MDCTSKLTSSGVRKRKGWRLEGAVPVSIASGDSGNVRGEMQEEMGRDECVGGSQQYVGTTVV